MTHILRCRCRINWPKSARCLSRVRDAFTCAGRTCPTRARPQLCDLACYWHCLDNNSKNTHLITADTAAMRNSIKQRSDKDPIRLNHSCKTPNQAPVLAQLIVQKYNDEGQPALARGMESYWEGAAGCCPRAVSNFIGQGGVPDGASAHEGLHKRARVRCIRIASCFVAAARA